MSYTPEEGYSDDEEVCEVCMEPIDNCTCDEAEEGIGNHALDHLPDERAREEEEDLREF